MQKQQIVKVQLHWRLFSSVTLYYFPKSSHCMGFVAIWKHHEEMILKKIREKANKISSLFMDKDLSPHPTTSLTLARSALLPIATYTAEHWLIEEERTKKSNNILDNIQSLIIKPVRIAFGLPRTTHRLGVMMDHRIPNLYALAITARIRYAKKYLDQRQKHPIRKLIKIETEKIIKRNSKHNKWLTFGERLMTKTLPKIYQMSNDLINNKIIDNIKLTEKILEKGKDY